MVHVCMDDPVTKSDFGTITSIEPQASGRRRVNVFVDETYSFSVSVDVARQLTLAPGLTLDGDLRDRIEQLEDQAAAYNAAISLLANRNRSEQEIRDRLRRKGHQPGSIDRTVERLMDLHYLDDREFARSWVENRQTFRPRGQYALRQELRSKGVDQLIIDETVAQDPIDEVMMAIAAARKKLPSLSSADPATRQRKLVGHLQRRGFSYGSIRSVLDQLTDFSGDEPNPSEDPPLI
ncbi:RecX family transcriptional regulator [soil metagenome]